MMVRGQVSLDALAHAFKLRHVTTDARYPNFIARLNQKRFKAMSAFDVAREIRSKLPGTEELIVDYLSNYLVDEASADEDSLQVTRNMLESFAESRATALDELIASLGKMLAAQLSQVAAQANVGPRKLEKALEMGKTGATSKTLAFTEGVDLESINKSK